MNFLYILEFICKDFAIFFTYNPHEKLRNKPTPHSRTSWSIFLTTIVLYLESKELLTNFRKIVGTRKSKKFCKYICATIFVSSNVLSHIQLNKNSRTHVYGNFSSDCSFFTFQSNMNNPDTEMRRRRLDGKFLHLFWLYKVYEFSHRNNIFFFLGLTFFECISLSTNFLLLIYTDVHII